MSRGHRASHAVFDEAAHYYDAWERSIAERRSSLIRAISVHYGVAVYPHPRWPRAVVVSESDYRLLTDAVMSDPLLNAVGRGYYSWLGGELAVVTAPDWTCDPRAVALARTRALLLDGPLRPYLRRLVAWSPAAKQGGPALSPQK
ncbi:hypothetical protein [Microbacterium aurum]